MRVQHLSHDHYRISDEDAGKLAKDAGKHLPKHGWEMIVQLPGGPLATLLRTPYAANLHKDAPKRGWVWCVMPRDRTFADYERWRAWIAAQGARGSRISPHGSSGGGGARAATKMKVAWVQQATADPEKKLGRRASYYAQGPAGGSYSVYPQRGCFIGGTWTPDKLCYAAVFKPPGSSGWGGDVEVNDAFASGKQRYPTWYETADKAKAAAERHALWFWRQVRP